MLSFDHASLVGPMDAVALAGLRLTRTPGHERHARVQLQRSYLEVRAQSTPLRGAGWFLRPRAPDDVAQWLATRGVSASQPAPYEGVDGVWCDITVGTAELGAAAPVVTHRLDTPGWPPPLQRPHPNGATAVTKLELAGPDPEALADLLRSLGAVPEPGSEAGVLAFGSVEVTIAAAAHPGITRVVLGCADGAGLALDLAG